MSILWVAMGCVDEEPVSSTPSSPVSSAPLCVIKGEPSSEQPPFDAPASLEIGLERAPGEDAILQGSNPEPGARVYLRMTTGVETHGGLAHAVVECEGLDEGELVLPGSFLDMLYSEGWTCGSCGSHALVRSRQDTTTTGGVEVRLHTATSFQHVPL